MTRTRSALALLLCSGLALHCGGSTEPAVTPPTPSGAPAASALPSATPVAQPRKDGPPVAAIRTVVNEYHGVKVNDDYQWLEKGADPEVKAWSDGQNAYTRKVLDGLPERAAVKARVAALLGSASPDRVVRVRLYKYMARVPLAATIVLLVFVLVSRGNGVRGIGAGCDGDGGEPAPAGR